MVVRVLANIEFDPETLINEVAKYYRCPVTEINMDNIVEYVNDHIYHMKGINTNVIKNVDDGWAIDGFEERDYWKISDILDQIQEETETD